MVNLTAAERVYEYWIDKASSAADLVLKIVFAVILFLVARKLILWLCGLIRKNMRRFNTEEAVVSFTVSMVKYSLNTLLVLTIIVQLGIVSEASIAAAIASAGVAVSLALQGGLSNFAGGVMILLLKPFKVGDYIIFPGEGQEGTVKKIEMYYTTINSIDNRTIMIPNANLTNHTIINVTAMDRRKLEIKVGISYESDIRKAKDILRRLVEEGYVSGWDDPRMPTLCGLRRRGYTPASIRNFCERIGVSKVASTVDYSFLEHCLREDLNLHAQRAMAVLHPVKLRITNYPEGQSETFAVENNPEDENAGTRDVTFSNELWIEADDFMEEPPKKYNRLYPGNEVRIKGAYIVRCTGCVKDADGNVTEVLCEYDPETRGGNTPDGRKVRGTIHWVDAHNCADAEVRLYDNLFADADPEGDGKDYLECLNPDSLSVLTGCKVERMLAGAEAPAAFQFLRLGYFAVDNKDSAPEHLVFNRAVALKDSFKKA